MFSGPASYPKLFYRGWSFFSTVMHSPPADSTASMSQIHQSPTKVSTCPLLVSNNYPAAQVKLSVLPGKTQISTQEDHFYLSNITIYLVQTEKSYQLTGSELTAMICWSQEMNQIGSPLCRTKNQPSLYVLVNNCTGNMVPVLRGISFSCKT